MSRTIRLALALLLSGSAPIATAATCHLGDLAHELDEAQHELDELKSEPHACPELDPASHELDEARHELRALIDERAKAADCPDEAKLEERIARVEDELAKARRGSDERDRKLEKVTSTAIGAGMPGEISPAEPTDGLDVDLLFGSATGSRDDEWEARPQARFGNGALELDLGGELPLDHGSPSRARASAAASARLLKDRSLAHPSLSAAASVVTAGESSPLEADFTLEASHTIRAYRLDLNASYGWKPDATDRLVFVGGLERQFGPTLRAVVDGWAAPVLGGTSWQAGGDLGAAVAASEHFVLEAGAGVAVMDGRVVPRVVAGIVVVR